MSDMDEPEETTTDSTQGDAPGIGPDGGRRERTEVQAESLEQNFRNPRETVENPASDSDDETVEGNSEMLSEDRHQNEYENDAEEGDEHEEAEEDEEEADEYEEEAEEDEEEADEYEEAEEDEEEADEYEEEADEYEEEAEEYEEEADEFEEEAEEDDEVEEDEEEVDEYEEETEEDDELEEDAEGEVEAEVDDADVRGEEEDAEEMIGHGAFGKGVSDDVFESDSVHLTPDETGSKTSQQDSVNDRLSDSVAAAELRSRAADLTSHAVLQFQTVALPIMHGEPFGMCRADGDGYELLDAMAGRNSVFGFGCTPIRESLESALAGYCGEGSRFASVAGGGESALSEKLEQMFAGATSVSVDSMTLLPSPDLAVEHALQLTRRFRSDKSFRTIALIGSDHGRTGMCRTASGQPHLHEGLGPMMAGFSHLPVGDLDALRAAVDEQTAGVLLSPIDLGSGALACEGDYLAGVRSICNERGVLLIVDETQLVFGSTGNHFTFSALADIHADIVVASGGLFGGLPGGLVLASQHAATGAVRDLEQYPLLAAALMATLNEMEMHGLPEVVHETAQELAVSIAEQLSGFEFVRDMKVTGMTIGIECDVNAVDVVAAAAANGLRVESAGDTAIRIQPPLLVSEEDRQLLLKRLVETMKAIERETAELTL